MEINMLNQDYSLFSLTCEEAFNGNRVGPRAADLKLPSLPEDTVQLAQPASEISGIRQDTMADITKDKIINGVLTMYRNLHSKYEDFPLFVGIGGSPEILFTFMRRMGVWPKPVMIPISDLPILSYLNEDHKNNLKQYFFKFIGNNANDALSIVVCDFVSTGGSLETAVTIIREMFPVIKVTPHPIAIKSIKSKSNELLSSDEPLPSFLNSNDLKRLTRSVVPHVPVTKSLLSTDEGLWKAFLIELDNMQKSDGFSHRRKNLLSILNGLEERASRTSVL